MLVAGCKRAAYRTAHGLADAQQGCGESVAGKRSHVQWREAKWEEKERDGFMTSKRIMALVAAAALAAMLGLAACGGSSASSSAASSASASAAASSAAAASPSASASESASASATSASAAAASQGSYIGDQAAIDIALEDAGFTAAEVTGLSAELDLDDAVVHYDVEFKQGGMEYDYDIDATTGAILSSSSEVDD